jgi:hypothetical protein
MGGSYKGIGGGGGRLERVLDRGARFFYIARNKVDRKKGGTRKKKGGERKRL